MKLAGPGWTKRFFARLKLGERSAQALSIRIRQAPRRHSSADQNPQWGLRANLDSAPGMAMAKRRPRLCGCDSVAGAGSEERLIQPLCSEGQVVRDARSAFFVPKILGLALDFDYLNLPELAGRPLFTRSPGPWPGSRCTPRKRSPILLWANLSSGGKNGRGEKRLRN